MKLVADLLIKNGLLVDPVRKTATEKDIAVKDGRIFSFIEMPARQVIDASGCYVSCGFIESHLHVEGLHLLPGHYAHAFLSHGTTTIVTDLHEVANSAGIAGLQWYLSLCDKVPLDLFVMAPSCVPSSKYEMGGARLGARELKALKRLDRVIGLGEVMDVEGVITRRKDVMRKIGIFEGMPVDGHAPLVAGEDLDLYLSAGIHSDHETTKEKEGLEKLDKGMHLFIREGSVAKDLDALRPLIRRDNLDRISLCTDDLSARDLFRQGHLDRIVSSLVRSGSSLFDSLRLITTNPALYFNLNDRNAPALGRKADLVLFDRPEEMHVLMTVKDGRIVYREGVDAPSPENGPIECPPSMRVASFPKGALRQKAKGRKIRVMDVSEGSILIDDGVVDARIEEGCLVADPARDIALAYAFDRYRAEEGYGFGFVRGFGLRSGALGTTYAHDSHNLIVVGTNVDDVHRVLETLKTSGGGMAASLGGETFCIPMPCFGIISPLDGKAFIEAAQELDGLVRKMGCSLKSPFFQMSFLSLPVIPHLRLTTKGLFHVATSRYVEANYD